MSLIRVQYDTMTTVNERCSCIQFLASHVLRGAILFTISQKHLGIGSHPGADYVIFLIYLFKLTGYLVIYLFNDFRVCHKFETIVLLPMHQIFNPSG